MTSKSGRGLLARLAVAFVGLISALTLAACSGGGNDLVIANWPDYIDDQTLPAFEEESGLTVEYNDEINDNDSFFGEVRLLLDQGESGGRSIMVPTDWMAEKMHDLDYLQDLDKSQLQTVNKNLIPSLANPSFDPGRKFSIPWQSGMTGLVVRKDLAPDITSVNDLFDPKYKGKVTVLKELRDTVPLIMAADGIRPESSTPQDWLDTIDKLSDAVASGQIRDFTGNDYSQELKNGSVVAAIGWSGDAIQYQAENENIDYVQPDQGCSLWSDSMVIPVGAPNVEAAYEFMNFVYEPKNAARIVAFNYYITPVKGVKEVLESSSNKDYQEAAKSELLFPSAEFTKNCFDISNPPGTPEEQEEIAQAFEDAVNQ